MNHSLQNNEEKIDLKVFIDRYLIFWKYIIFSIATFLIIGFLYNRYSTKIYKSSTTILIKAWIKEKITSTSPSSQ